MHNQENPVTFEQAKQELGVSEFVLTALRSQLGIRGRRPFLLSPIRDFLKDNPGWTTAEVYKRKDKPATIQLTHDGKRWVAAVKNKPELMAIGKSIQDALASVGKMLDNSQSAA